jgi:GNAT superfamily N-acetyltransferase
MQATVDVVRSIEENCAEFLLALGRAGGGEERDEEAGPPSPGGETGRLHWSIGGSPIAYHNPVVRVDLTPEQADEAIAASVERLRALGVPGSWHVGPSMRPPDLRKRLRAHGFSGCEPGGEPGMAASLDSLPEDVPHPGGLVVERVRDRAQLELFRRVLASGFGEGEPEANWVCEMYARIGLGDDTAWRHYLGRIDGAPVSTTSVFFAAGVAGLYFVCTAPHYRRQGVGAATTLAAMRGAREEGYRSAVLTSSPMGYRVYEQLGFREYCQIGVPEYDPRPAVG